MPGSGFSYISNHVLPRMRILAQAIRILILKLKAISLNICGFGKRNLKVPAELVQGVPFSFCWILKRKEKVKELGFRSVLLDLTRRKQEMHE
jgi:hypothetical protein